jgi:putative ABC transport system permease protein
LIGGIGGVVTVALVTVMLQLFLPGLPIALKPEIVTVALLVSMVVGLMAGVRPALNATRLSPIDALRGE